MSPINDNSHKKNVVTSDDNNESELLLDVLIIGAGWSGLATAKELKAKGINNVKILEGRSTYGGRCRSEIMADGITVAEKGAQWIHGARKSNPVYQTALQAEGVDLKRSTYSSQAVYQSIDDDKCKLVDGDRYKFFYDYCMEGKGGFWAYQEERQEEDDHDVSLRQCAEDFKRKINMTKEQKRWFEYILESEIVQEYSGAIEDMSMFWWDSDEDMAGEDVEMAGKGYQGILEHYIQGIEDLIEYNSKVTQIDWSTKNQVTVTYIQNDDQVEQQITARRVVVTVPIGVLQANTIKFQPALPPAKKKAIAGIGMGLLNKCLFLWDEDDIPNLPWVQQQNCEWIERIVAPNSQHPQGLWTESFNTLPVTGRPVLCCFTAGNVARQVEQWSEQEIQQSAWKALQHQFQRQDIPQPRQVIITKWGQDEWARGSYSYNNIGGKHNNRKKLAEPLDGRLYFAGEACHAQYFGTTHGALLSGVATAKQIAKQHGNAAKKLTKKAMAAAKKGIQAVTSATKGAAPESASATTTTAVAVGTLLISHEDATIV